MLSRKKLAWAKGFIGIEFVNEPDALRFPAAIIVQLVSGVSRFVASKMA